MFFLIPVVLGVLQMALPRDSLLNPYPRWAPAFNGVFENPNHQGTMLALAATIVASLHWTGRDAAGLLHSGTAAWTGLGVVLLLAIPLTGSRAAVGLGVLVVAGRGFTVPFAARLQGWAARRGDGGRLSTVLLGAVYGLFALGIVLVHRGTRVINFAAPEVGAFATSVR